MATRSRPRFRAGPSTIPARSRRSTRMAPTTFASTTATARRASRSSTSERSAVAVVALAPPAEKGIGTGIGTVIGTGTVTRTEIAATTREAAPASSLGRRSRQKSRGGPSTTLARSKRSTATALTSSGLTMVGLCLLLFSISFSLLFSIWLGSPFLVIS